IRMNGRSLTSAKFSTCRIPHLLLYNNGNVKAWSILGRRQRAGRLVGLLMLALWLGTSALAASPQLTHLLHSDSQNSNHVCLVTQIKHHPWLVAFIPLTAPPPAVSAALPDDPVDPQLPRGRDYRTAQSRAPPSAVSSNPVTG